MQLNTETKGIQFDELMGGGNLTRQNIKLNATGGIMRGTLVEATKLKLSADTSGTTVWEKTSTAPDGTKLYGILADDVTDNANADAKIYITGCFNAQAVTVSTVKIQQFINCLAAQGIILTNLV